MWVAAGPDARGNVGDFADRFEPAPNDQNADPDGDDDEQRNDPGHVRDELAQQGARQHVRALGASNRDRNRAGGALERNAEPMISLRRGPEVAQTEVARLIARQRPFRGNLSEAGWSGGEEPTVRRAHRENVGASGAIGSRESGRKIETRSARAGHRVVGKIRSAQVAVALA
jgi:hypothetical protein